MCRTYCSCHSSKVVNQWFFTVCLIGHFNGLTNVDVVFLLTLKKCGNPSQLLQLNNVLLSLRILLGTSN